MKDKSIYIKDLRRHATPLGGRDGALQALRATPVSDKETPDDAGMPAPYEWTDGVDDRDFAESVVARFENAKLLWGKVDFTDLLLKYAGLKFSGGKLTTELPVGFEPDEVKVWFIDEAQDCSQLLWAAADRLTTHADRVYLLGDPYQSVYRFLGADPDELLDRQERARQNGSYTLLNRTWRNPAQVIEWAEQVLMEQKSYRSRNPISEHDNGSVGLVEFQDFARRIHDLSTIDTLILGRTWFTLERIQKLLNEKGIPWTSVAEKQSSRWQAPAKLAFVICMRDLAAGNQISEQDWRRITETLPQKFNGQELFKRGEKAKWKKMACRHAPERTLSELEEWGATPYFQEFTLSGQWKTDMFALMDFAIEKWGIDVVRKPRIRLGTCHSVKGMEAKVVYCIAASTEASQNADEREECCLKYVTITRASSDYRLVVDEADILRGKPLFWAAPATVRGYDRKQEFLDARIADSETDHRLADETEDLLAEEAGLGILTGRSPGPDPVRQREVRGDGSENAERETGSAAETGAGADQEEWWAF